MFFLCSFDWHLTHILHFLSRLQIKVFARAASQEGSEAYAAVVRCLLEKEADRSLTRKEAKHLARLREGWSRAGANAAAEYERLLERERMGELTPAEKIKLDEWRDGMQLGRELGTCMMRDASRKHFRLYKNILQLSFTRPPRLCRALLPGHSLLLHHCRRPRHYFCHRLVGLLLRRRLRHILRFHRRHSTNRRHT